MSESNPKRERGRGRLFLRGATWWLQYYSHGRQIRVSSRSTDEKVAQKLLQKLLGEVGAGIHRELRRLTYEDLQRAFFDDYITNKRKSLRRSKETGEPRLDAVTRLNGFFAGFRTAEIDTDLIRRFIRDQQAKGLTNGTINRSLAALRRMFYLAVQDEKLKTVPYFPMLKEAAARKGVLEHDKYPLLLAALPEYLRPVLTLGYHTGMRLGEIQHLQWDQIDFLNHIIRLNAGETKNNEAREIPISDELYAMLEESHLKRPAGCPFVCNRDGRPVGDFRKAWYARCVRLGLGRIEGAKYRGLIFHDLRRTFVSDAEYAGAPRHEVMKVTGHKTESVYKRYAIDNRLQRQAAMNTIVAYRKFGDKAGTSDQKEAVEREAVTHLTN